MVMGLQEDNVSDERIERCIKWLADYNASLNKGEQVPTGEDFNAVVFGATAILHDGWEPEPFEEEPTGETMNVVCHMSERVFYTVNVTVPVDADDDAIAAAAEEMFVQGHYEEGGQDDRQLDSWEPEA